jgi:hypothetical protein
MCQPGDVRTALDRITAWLDAAGSALDRVPVAVATVLLVVAQAAVCFGVVAALEPGWGYVIGLSAVLALFAPAWWRALEPR